MRQQAKHIDRLVKYLKLLPVYYASYLGINTSGINAGPVTYNNGTTYNTGSSNLGGNVNVSIYIYNYYVYFKPNTSTDVFYFSSY